MSSKQEFIKRKRSQRGDSATKLIQRQKHTKLAKTAKRCETGLIYLRALGDLLFKLQLLHHRERILKWDVSSAG